MEIIPNVKVSADVSKILWLNISDKIWGWYDNIIGLHHCWNTKSIPSHIVAGSAYSKGLHLDIFWQ